MNVLHADVVCHRVKNNPKAESVIFVICLIVWENSKASNNGNLENINGILLRLFAGVGGIN